MDIVMANIYLHWNEENPVVIVNAPSCGAVLSVGPIRDHHWWDTVVLASLNLNEFCCGVVLYYIACSAWTIQYLYSLHRSMGVCFLLYIWSCMLLKASSKAVWNFIFQDLEAVAIGNDESEGSACNEAFNVLSTLKVLIPLLAPSFIYTKWFFRERKLNWKKENEKSKKRRMSTTQQV